MSRRSLLVLRAVGGAEGVGRREGKKQPESPRTNRGHTPIRSLFTIHSLSNHYLVTFRQIKVVDELSEMASIASGWRREVKSLLPHPLQNL